MLGASPHLEVVAEGGRMENWLAILNIVAQHPQVAPPHLMWQGKACCRSDRTLQGVMVRGINPAQETAITELAQQDQGGRAGRFARRGVQHRASAPIWRAHWACASTTRHADRPQARSRRRMIPASTVPRGAIFEIGMPPMTTASR